jgi:hypothetical protein
MNKPLRVTLLLPFVAALTTYSLPAPSLAGVDGADYVVWRLPSPGPRGLGLMRERASDSTLLAEAVGLVPNSAYRYVGSTKSCASGHSAADVVWSRNFQSNGKGAALLDTTVAPSEITQSLRSIRLFRGSAESDCAAALRYRSDGGGQTTDAFAHLSLKSFGANALVFVDLGNPNDKLTVAGHGFISSHGYRLVAADVSCPTQPSPATTLFQKSGVTNSVGVMWRHNTGRNLTNKTPRSIQLFKPSNDRVACANTTMLNAAL